MVEKELVPKSSKMQGHFFSADLSDNTYNYRVLKMTNSLFIYIGPSDNEAFNEMAMAMPMVDTDECLATTIMGEQMCSSHDLAMNFAKKLKKQIYVTCNVPKELDIKAALAKRFTEEVQKCPEYF